MQGIVNSDLAAMSDMTYQGMFVVYLVALVASLFFYVQRQSVIRRREAGEDAEELRRREARAGKFRGATQALVWLGLILHLASWVTRGLSAQRFPLGNLYEYALGISFMTILIAAIVIQRRNQAVAWPWLLTPTIVLLFLAGTVLYADSAPVVPALQSYWLPIHVTTVSLGGSLGLVSSAFSVLFLLRTAQPKGKEKGFFGALARPLPDAARLDEVAYRLAVFTLPTLGLGIIFGAIWAEAAWTRPWGWDPKETVSFISWILYAAYLHARATAGWKVGAAWINILAMATMVFNLFFINMVVDSLHSYAGIN